jgi:hypothetical protein
MSAASYDIVIEQGSDFLLGLQLKDAKDRPFDLTGITATAQVRENLKNALPLVSFDITFDSDRKTGKVTLFIPASITKELNFVSGFYDLKFMSSTGLTKRIMGGKVVFSQEVTA